MFRYAAAEKQLSFTLSQPSLTVFAAAVQVTQVKVQKYQEVPSASCKSRLEVDQVSKLNKIVVNEQTNNEIFSQI